MISMVLLVWCGMVETIGGSLGGPHVVFSQKIWGMAFRVKFISIIGKNLSKMMYLWVGSTVKALMCSFTTFSFTIDRSAICLIRTIVVRTIVINPTYLQRLIQNLQVRSMNDSKIQSCFSQHSGD